VKNARQNARASWSDPNVPGNAGQYFSVLNCASLNGLSLLTFGRECDLRMSRSESSAGTGLDVIEVPRSAWMACGAVPPLRRTASVMKSFASSPSSAACTSKCTAHRQKMSIITYRW
jgi:hypothetical protein